MITNAQKQKVVDLRIKGLSHDRISRLLGISKPTLLKITAAYENDISEGTNKQRDEMVQSYLSAMNLKISTFTSNIEALSIELESRDPKDMSTKEIIQVMSVMSRELDLDLKAVNNVGERTREESNRQRAFEDILDDLDSRATY